jgi:hypothetical protein
MTLSFLFGVAVLYFLYKIYKILKIEVEFWRELNKE